jgi:DnaJ domain
LSSFTFDIEPHTVLGVTPNATLAEIRDAYRQKCKIFHPDAGGEEWAFRILVRSYEMLSTARVVKATRDEPGRARPGPDAGVGDRSMDRRPEPSAESLRGGIHDASVQATRILAVEHLCVRYLWDDAAYLWLVRKQPDEERFLSCSLNLTWPDQGVNLADVTDKDATSVVRDLTEIFDHMVVSSRVITSRCHAGEQDFAGWLTYSSFDRSWKALKNLHDAVRSRDLGLRQWSRDLFIPKNWA